MRIDRRSFFRVMAGVGALVGMRSRAAFADPDASDIHQATRNTRLGALGVRRPRLTRPPRPFKLYTGKRRIDLPGLAEKPSRPLVNVVREWQTTDGFANAKISLEQLSRLLHFTNGVTDAAVSGREPRRRRRARRAAPSAGGLYSGEIYVAATRVSGLASGIYNYDVHRHALAEVSGVVSAESIGALIQAAVDDSVSIEGASAVVLISNVFERYSWRYANRGYRYALIDTGHIGENLRLAAAASGLGNRLYLRFQDDRLNELLGIDGRREAVCAVHAIGSAGEGQEGQTERGEPRSDWIEAQRLPTFAVPDDETERYHAATKLTDPGGAKGGASKTDPPPQPRARPTRSAPPPESIIELPKAGPAAKLTLEEAIQIRRSTARFESSSLGLPDLAQILEMAHGHDALALADGVDVLIVAHRVETLAAGLYRYDPSQHRLVKLRGGSLVKDLTRVCLGQEKAGTAAVGVLMVAHLGEGRAAAKTRRYRDLLIESGAIGQRVYLAAESLGVSARNLAAYLDDDLNALLGLDGETEAAVHLTMLGPGN